MENPILNANKFSSKPVVSYHVGFGFLREAGYFFPGRADKNVGSGGKSDANKESELIESADHAMKRP